MGTQNGRLQLYNPICKGSHNVIADALSRSPIVNPKGLHQDKVITLLPRELWLPDTLSPPEMNRWLVEDQLEKDELLKLAHDHPLSRHPGICQTLYNIKTYGQWPQMWEDITKYISSCPSCQCFKILWNWLYSLLNPLPPVTSPFKRILIDQIAPLPISNGFNAIFVLVDYLTKYKLFFPTKTTDKSLDLVNLFMSKVFPLFSTPQEIISDWGTTFVSKFTTTLWKQLNILPSTSTAYHPQNNGQTKCANQELKQYLWFYCNWQQDNWSNLLPFTQFAINSHFYSSINNTPFNLLLGYTSW